MLKQIIPVSSLDRPKHTQSCLCFFKKNSTSTVRKDYRVGEIIKEKQPQLSYIFSPSHMLAASEHSDHPSSTNKLHIRIDTYTVNDFIEFKCENYVGRFDVGPCRKSSTKGRQTGEQSAEGHRIEKGSVSSLSPKRDVNRKPWPHCSLTLRPRAKVDPDEREFVERISLLLLLLRGRKVLRSMKLDGDGNAFYSLLWGEFQWAFALTWSRTSNRIPFFLASHVPISIPRRLRRSYVYSFVLGKIWVAQFSEVERRVSKRSKGFPSILNRKTVGWVNGMPALIEFW